MGYHPQVILAGRRINDRMGAHITHSLVKMLAPRPVPLRHARVDVLCLTFEDNVRDLRKCRVPTSCTKLQANGTTVLAYDDLADPTEAQQKYGIELQPWAELQGLDTIVLVVPHKATRPAFGKPVHGFRNRTARSSR